MVYDNQEGDRPHNLEATEDFLFVIATGASDAMSVIERPGWMRWNAGRRARCGKREIKIAAKDVDPAGCKVFQWAAGRSREASSNTPGQIGRAAGRERGRKY